MSHPHTSTRVGGDVFLSNNKADTFYQEMVHGGRQVVFSSESNKNTNNSLIPCGRFCCGRFALPSVKHCGVK